MAKGWRRNLNIDMRVGTEEALGPKDKQELLYLRGCPSSQMVICDPASPHSSTYILASNYPLKHISEECKE